MRRILPVIALAPLLVLSPEPAGAVVGGDAADPGEWPWQVALLEDGSVVCGGSLVALDVVVTAAHCTDGVGAGRMEVMAGSVELDRGGQRRDVARVDQHEGYMADTNRNDIALLRLESPFDAGDRIQPVPLPGNGSSPDLLRRGAPVVVTGFGATSEEGDVSPVLREVEIDVLDDATCTRRYAEDGDDIFGASQVCAGLDRGHLDACYGDSGGPLVAPVEDDRSSWVLVGIVSWGAGCGRPLRPTVYTEVAAFAGWVAEHGGPDVDGERFAAATHNDDSVLRLPAAGVSRGKAGRYPAAVQVDGFDGDVAGVTVELHGLTHERPSDLDVWLEAPDGTVVTLLSDVGGDQPVAGLDVVVDDRAADAGDGALPPWVGPTDREPDSQRKGARPPASLADLVGVGADGEWHLLVADDRSGATGELEGWTLVLR